MSYLLIMVDEKGYRLNIKTWPSLLLMMSGAFLWSGMKKRTRSFYHNFTPDEE